jgi:hypothetical protein
MKKTIVILLPVIIIGVLIAAFVTKCDPPIEKPVKHVIMLAPWLATPPSPGAPPPIPRIEAQKMLTSFFKGLSPKILGADPVNFKMLDGPKNNIDKPLAGASVFTAILTPTVARLLQEKLPFFVSPHQSIVPVPIETATYQDIGEEPPAGGPPEIRMTAGYARWAANVNVVTQNYGVIDRAFVRSPVFYVVDTGVQPFIKTGSNPDTYDWHPQLREPILAGRLKIRQGQVADSIEVWPPVNPQDAMNVWETTPVGQLINLAGPPLPIPALPSTMANVHPYLVDGTGATMGADDMHGTKVTIAALGMLAPGSTSKSAGILGRFAIQGSAAHAIELESVRVFPAGVSPAANFDALKGIYAVIQSHVDRMNAAGGAMVPSVMLFTSRTTSTTGGFDQNLEAALWWAWKHGIVCVCAAGNEITTEYPNSRWYQSLGVIQPPATTSPSRFDWDVPNGNEAARAYWPNWTHVTTPPGNPYPNEPYLIMVGASNPTPTYTNRAGWGTWNGGANGSARGRDVDILAPGVGVACALTNKNSDPDALMLANGTSLSAGHVAGAALVYVASSAPPPAGVGYSTLFRSWLFPAPDPATGVPFDTAPCAIVTGAAAQYNSPPAYTPYHNTRPPPYTTLPAPSTIRVPKLKITTSTSW